MGAGQGPSHMPGLAHKLSSDRKAGLQGTWVPKSLPRGTPRLGFSSKTDGSPPPPVAKGPRYEPVGLCGISSAT